MGADRLKVLIAGAGHGIVPRWDTAFTGLVKNDETGVTASLSGPNGTWECEANILAGADGAHSQVRNCLVLTSLARAILRHFT
jgi:2-polyprenyl-6-methoxyphenol hydroxylase-like FAD-dependent oxidoreductase